MEGKHISISIAVSSKGSVNNMRDTLQHGGRPLSRLQRLQRGGSGLDHRWEDMGVQFFGSSANKNRWVMQIDIYHLVEVD